MVQGRVVGCDAISGMPSSGATPVPWAHVLTAVDQNKTRAAKVLGVDRRTLYRRLQRHDLK